MQGYETTGCLLSVLGHFAPPSHATNTARPRLAGHPGPHPAAFQTPPAKGDSSSLGQPGGHLVTHRATKCSGVQPLLPGRLQPLGLSLGTPGTYLSLPTRVMLTEQTPHSPAGFRVRRAEAAPFISQHHQGWKKPPRPPGLSTPLPPLAPEPPNHVPNPQLQLSLTPERDGDTTTSCPVCPTACPLPEDNFWQGPRAPPGRDLGPSLTISPLISLTNSPGSCGHGRGAGPARCQRARYPSER